MRKIFSKYNLPANSLPNGKGWGWAFILALSSCGNSTSTINPPPSTDSIAADLASINSAIEKDRSNPDLYFRRAHYYFEHKNYADAITDMQIVLKFDSASAKNYIFLSDLYLTQNKTKDTRNMLRKAMKCDSASTEALLKYSELFFLARKYDTAMFYINRSLHFDRTRASAHFQKGMILKETGDTARAISSFQDAIRADQNYYNAYMQLGVLYARKKNPLALEYLDGALRIEPKSAEAFYNKGYFLQNTGAYEKALSVYDSLLVLAPQHFDALFNQGAILFEQKKPDEALQKFNSILAKDANFFRAYYGRGRCYEAKGLTQKAMNDYKRCLALNPDYDLAAFQLDRLEKKK
ncbi:MAG: tetratricopeptide repeat protein [Bacteroidetes bacterium]|nr:tetratricopeptide repeat protein [Bacteroidota bacterium]